MNHMKKLGTYGDYHFFRGTRHGVTGVFYGPNENTAINLIDTDCYKETVEGFVQALRTAAEDPRDRVIRAARAAVDSWDSESDEWNTEKVEDLADAIAALDEAKAEDAE